MKSPTRQLATTLVASAVTLGALTAPGLAAPGTPVPAKQAGKVVAWGAELHAMVPEDIAAKHIVAVAAGDWYNLTLDSAGKVEAWGDPGRAPVNAFPAGGVRDAKAMAATTENAVVLKNDGSIIAWGAAGTGINSVPAELTNAKAVDVTGFVGLAVRADGTVATWGANSGLFPVPAELTGVVDVDAGVMHTLALKSDGTVVGWGIMGGTPPEAVAPAEIQGHVVAIGAGINTSAAVTDDGKVHVWGGEMGTPPAELADEKVVDIAMDESIVVRTESGKVFAWGSATTPDITAMTTIPEALDGEYVSAIAAGKRHNIAIMTPMRAVSAPVITGVAKVGQTLTASDAQFSRAGVGGDAVEGQRCTAHWCDGVEAAADRRTRRQEDHGHADRYSWGQDVRGKLDGNGCGDSAAGGVECAGVCWWCAVWGGAAGCGELVAGGCVGAGGCVPGW